MSTKSGGLAYWGSLINEASLRSSSPEPLIFQLLRTHIICPGVQSSCVSFLCNSSSQEISKHAQELDGLICWSFFHTDDLNLILLCICSHGCCCLFYMDFMVRLSIRYSYSFGFACVFEMSNVDRSIEFCKSAVLYFAQSHGAFVETENSILN